MCKSRGLIQTFCQEPKSIKQNSKGHWETWLLCGNLSPAVIEGIRGSGVALAISKQSGSSLYLVGLLNHVNTDSIDMRLLYHCLSIITNM